MYSSKRSICVLSPMDPGSRNGMQQRLIQDLRQLSLNFNAVSIIATRGDTVGLGAFLTEADLRSIKIVSGLIINILKIELFTWRLVNYLLCDKLGVIQNYLLWRLVSSYFVRMDKFSYIFVYYPWLVILLGLRQKRVKYIVDAADVMANRHIRLGRRNWISLSHADECSVLRNAHRVISIAQYDSEIFRNNYGVLTHCIPYIPSSSSDLCKKSSQRIRIGFFASNSKENIDSVILLCKVIEKSPVFQEFFLFKIAGGICNAPRVRDLNNRKWVCIVGKIEQEIEFYSQVDLTINLCGPSTGMKIKTVESLFYNIPCIVTKYATDIILSQSFAKLTKCVGYNEASVRDELYKIMKSKNNGYDPNEFKNKVDALKKMVDGRYRTVFS